MRYIDPMGDDINIIMDKDVPDWSADEVNEAYHMAKGQKANVNAKFDNDYEDGVEANLITGKLITAKNIDKILIESGYFTKEEIYGTE